MAVLRIVGIEADADARADEDLRPPSSCSGWLTSSIGSRASSPASSGRCSASITTTNSSPPRRARVSSCRTCCRDAAPASPAGNRRPDGREAVIDVLEAVHIEKQHRQTVLVAIGNGDRMLQAVEQQNPVG